MNIILDFQMTELELDLERTYYNHIFYKIKNNKQGLTHLVEIYDDVNDCPEYTLGTVEGDSFNGKLQGYGEPIPENKVGVGGVSIKITLYHGELKL